LPFTESKTSSASVFCVAGSFLPVAGSTVPDFGSSWVPLARMNSLSWIARVARSGVEATVWAAISASEGAGVIVKPGGGFRLALAAAVTAS
jgi:hypothetical protein